jgi:hypothetical protein
MNHATTKQLMRLTHIPELLSLTQRIPTSGHDCSCFAAAIPRDPISTTHQCLRTFTHKRTRITWGHLQARSGQAGHLKLHNLLRTSLLQDVLTTGQGQSLISLLHSNFLNLIPTIRETEDFKVLARHHLVKNHLVPIKKHPATLQCENNTRHPQR